MRNNLRVVMAQINFLVGNIEHNQQSVITNAIKARDELQADMVIFPELTLTGYPPEDLLLRHDMYPRIEKALTEICEQVHGIDIVLGFPWRENGGIYNSATVIRDGERIATYYKQRLPNYSVFDEQRYFIPGTEPCIFTAKGIKFAVTICEDLWAPYTLHKAKQRGAQVAISINASPYHSYKVTLREEMLRERIAEDHLPILYVHWVGGQDELVFDGGSMAVDKAGQICQRANYFTEQLLAIDIALDDNLAITKTPITPPPNDEESLYSALVLGIRDYIHKNGFKKVFIGLSGGIDSALSLAIAVDAIGAENVTAVMMPSRYTSDMSIDDAEQIAKNLGVTYKTFSIESMFQAMLNTLEDEFKGLLAGVTEENLQARCRANILMALANKFKGLVLTTGNKSEMAVGYCTLYGDMAGGFSVLKDVWKTNVYRLAHYRNKIKAVIPQRIITRPPSAELSADQTDQDTLPPYETLDKILDRYVEEDQGLDEIIAAGFDETTVKKVLRMVDNAEYKRRQSPPGVRVSHRAFGRDRRYPITSGYGEW